MNRQQFMYIPEPVCAFIPNDQMPTICETELLTLDMHYGLGDIGTMNLLFDKIQNTIMNENAHPTKLIISLDVYKSIIRYLHRRMENSAQFQFPLTFDGIELVLVDVDRKRFIQVITAQDAMTVFTKLLYKESKL